MPPHEVYIETHLGGGSVIFNKRPTTNNIGIEINPKIFNILRNSHRTDIKFINDDAVEYLKNYQFTGKELIYCDPPYLRETRKNRRRLYKYEYTLEQHIELLEVIKTLPCKVMISGYESSLYKKYLKGWHTRFFEASCNHGFGTEWIWMNYSAPVKLHDYRYLGDNFRQRERIKKKTNIWLAKFKSMPILERQALLHAIKTIKGET